MPAPNAARTAMVLGAIATSFLAASFIFVVLRGGADSVPEDRLVVAVLPAHSTSGLDGRIAEGVTRELARIDPSILGVVGPASLGRRELGTIEPLAVGRTVGAHLVLVIEAGESIAADSPVRVSILEVEDGSEFWTRSYDEDPDGSQGLVRRITGDAIEALSLPSPSH